jgi:hypothetical protein
MVKKLWLLALLGGALWSGWVAAEARLQVRADKKSVVLGEPLMVEVKAEDVSVPLSSIKLDKLKKSFNVYGISSNSHSRKVNGRTVAGETMTLTLYPLRSGKIQLPALSYMGKSSAPLVVSVLESDKHTSRVIFKTAVDALRPMVRQAVTLTLEIYDDGSRQWTAPQELAATGAHQRRLAETQREEVAEGVRYTVHRYAWALMPLRDGVLAVEFPLVDAFKFGTRLRYPLAPLRIEAVPAPAYLPVHVPIGKPVVTLEPLPAEIALNRPVSLVLSVQGSGVSAEGLSKMLSALHSNDSLRIYPLQISSSDNERPASATQTLQVALTFVPLRAGLLKLPEINLPYFNIENARVESILIPGADIEVFNPLWHTVELIALGMTALAGAGSAVFWMYRQLRCILKRRRYLQAIKHAAGAGELRQALLNFDAQTPFHTLQQWLQYMQRAYGVDEQLVVIVQKLEAVQYSVIDADLQITALAGEAANRLATLTIKKYCRHIAIFKPILYIAT